ncbi:MAG TPA: hypothetical protein VJY62_11650 [Bacteroidia bacterium]|nr:hypothetical protein [Bacteroidia bacterium]
MKDTKTAREKKKKSAAKKKTTGIPAKKLKKPVTNKAKSAARKKTKGPVGGKIKTAARKNIMKTAAGKPTRAAGKKTKQAVKAKTKNPVKPQPVEEKITHGEDLHLIPVEGEIHPIGADEANRLENIFQKREEVTLQQENRKVKDALGSRKNLIKNFRIPRHKG